MPISVGSCRFQPGSVKSGGTWQVAHAPCPSKIALPARGRGRVEDAGRRLRRGKRELVEVERRELRRDQVGLVARRCPKPALGRDRELLRVVEPRRRRTSPCRASRGWRRTHSSRSPSPSPVHVCEVDAGEPERGRDQRRRACLPSGRKALPSRNSSASNLPGPQLASTFVDGRLVDAEQVGERLQVRAPATTIAPTLRSRFGQPSSRLADAGRERVVDGRVAERAL